MFSRLKENDQVAQTSSSQGQLLVQLSSFSIDGLTLVSFDVFNRCLFRVVGVPAGWFPRPLPCDHRDGPFPQRPAGKGGLDVLDLTTKARQCSIEQLLLIFLT